MHVTCLARGWKQSPVRGHYPGIPCWDFRCHSVLLLCCCQGNEHMQISRSKTCNYKNEENIITEVLGSHSAIDVRLGPAASFVSVLAPCNDCSRKGVRPRHQSSGSPRRVARPRRSHWALRLGTAMLLARAQHAVVTEELCRSCTDRQPCSPQPSPASPSASPSPSPACSPSSAPQPSLGSRLQLGGWG